MNEIPVYNGYVISSIFLLEPQEFGNPGKRLYPNGIELQLAHGRNGIIRWKITDSTWTLNHKGQWEYEPNPSSRTDAYFRRCRFNSIDEALEIWNRYKDKLL
jgi:hypothetical protein